MKQLRPVGDSRGFRIGGASPKLHPRPETRSSRSLDGRPGWGAVTAVRHDRIFEIKSTYILQPGPAALTEGVKQLHSLLAKVHEIGVRPSTRPSSESTS